MDFLSSVHLLAPLSARYIGRGAETDVLSTAEKLQLDLCHLLPLHAPPPYFCNGFTLNFLNCNKIHDIKFIALTIFM